VRNSRLDRDAGKESDLLAPAPLFVCLPPAAFDGVPRRVRALTGHLHRCALSLHFDALGHASGG